MNAKQTKILQFLQERRTVDEGWMRGYEIMEALDMRSSVVYGSLYHLQEASLVEHRETPTEERPVFHFRATSDSGGLPEEQEQKVRKSRVGWNLGEAKA